MSHSQLRKTVTSLVTVVMWVALLLPIRALGQQPTGSIEGTVTDPQGAVVPGATVTARQITTNLTRSVTAGDAGAYKIEQIPPGNYELKVTGQGFKSTVVSNIKVDVGSHVPVDVKLEIGGATETVNVTATGEAQIDRTDNTVSGVVGTLQIQNLPLNGRNFLDLARLQPGAEAVDGASFDPTKANYTGVAIAGQAGRSTQITVDGGSVVDNIVGTTVQNFSQEIVQEFQLGISNFDLSTGASATGSVNIISKSGTNAYHGNAYVYWRDSSFSAFPGLNRLDAIHGIPPELRKDQVPFNREQFGGTFGGPIKKDKLFFFANYEQNRQRAVAIHNLNPGIIGFNGFTANPFNEKLGTGKVDWQMSDRMKSFVRFSHDTNDQTAPFPPGTGIAPKQSASGIFQSDDQFDENRSDGFVVGVTRSLRANLVNDFRYNYNNFHNFIGGVTKDFPEIRVYTAGFNQDWRSGTNYLTPQITDQLRNQVRDDLVWSKGRHTLHFGGDWEWTKIDGQFAFAKPARIRIFGPGFDARSPARLETEADFLNAPVRNMSMGIGNDLLPFNTKSGETVNHRFQIYAADQWKITRTLTLSPGIAYRIDTNLWNHDQGHPAIIAPLFGRGTKPSPKDTNNFAPRLGFAWDVNGNGRTVVRGGFGMYYDTTIDNLRLFERADLGPPGAELFLGSTSLRSSLLPGNHDASFSSNPASSSGFILLKDLLKLFPAVRKDVEANAFKCSFPTSVECFHSVSGPLFSTEFQIPYSLQYSVGIQKELFWKMLLQADFNYRKGVHEVLTYDANFADSVDKNGNPTPRFKSIDFNVPYADSSAFSTYKALLLRVDRRFANGFQLTTSYTLSRFKNFGGDGLGLGEGITNRNSFKADYGIALSDRIHRLVVSGLWELPFFKDSPSKFNKIVLGGWTVSLISTAFSGLAEDALLPDGVNLSGTNPLTAGDYLPGTKPGDIGRKITSVSKLNELIKNYNANRKSFAARIEGGVPVDPFGTELRELALIPEDTQIGGDSLISQDVRITKGFRFTESKRFDFIVEVFNLFNVANLSNISSFVIPAKDDITKPSDIETFRPTQRTTNVFGTGGPRSFQFAWKFTF